ncbi:MAG TPA: hypothetical protein PLV72_00515 [Candidatus Magasanikbacteria bacterium]|nr:hypothetical protein [Candidatus Magasanikbacteria bacterium]
MLNGISLGEYLFIPRIWRFMPGYRIVHYTHEPGEPGHLLLVIIWGYGDSPKQELKTIEKGFPIQIRIGHQRLKVVRSVFEYRRRNDGVEFLEARINVQAIEKHKREIPEEGRVISFEEAINSLAR